MFFDRRTNYQRGADFERKVRDYFLHDLEAKLVVRSGGSHGVADLAVFFDAANWAYPPETAYAHPIANVWLVQVKKDGKLPAEEREALLQVAAETGTTPVLAWHDHGRGVAITHLQEGAT